MQKNIIQENHKNLFSLMEIINNDNLFKKNQ